MMTLDECIAAARLPITVGYMPDGVASDGASVIGWWMGDGLWWVFRRTQVNATKQYIKRRTALLQRRSRTRLSEQQGEKR